MDLRQYDHAKSELAEILRSATMHTDRNPAEVRDLFARLAQDRFNLVVVGRFNRGKTSLMNAMLGTDRLPTGIVPVTSVITTVSYGSEEKVVLYYRYTSLFLEIPISRLAEHITERGNPRQCRPGIILAFSATGAHRQAAWRRDRARCKRVACIPDRATQLPG